MFGTLVKITSVDIVNYVFVMKGYIRMFASQLPKHLFQKVKQFSKIPCRNIYQSLRSKSDDVINVSEEVLGNLHAGKPVVALESAIITHGLPYPENFRIAKEVEEVVKQNGSVPATIGIMDGKIYVGLSEDELEILSKYQNAVKVASRDIPYVLSQKLTGGTTVSATILISDRVGIPIFATGGIGGVHRHGEITLDISSDLTELGRTPITVVSAGVKSILDIEKTLEYLETQGVCVTTFGPSQDFPAFFAPKSGHLVSSNVKTPEEAAKLIDSRDDLEMGSGILIAVPIPEEQETDCDAIEAAIQKAVAEAEIYKMRGKEVTPFILKKVSEITGGKSLEANRVLIRNNAKVASQIAFELTRMKFRKGISSESEKSFGGRGSAGNPLSFRTSSFRPNVKNYSTFCAPARPVIIGGSIVDIVVMLKEDKLEHPIDSIRNVTRR